MKRTLCAAMLSTTAIVNLNAVKPNKRLAAESGDEQLKPNILIIMADDMSYGEV